MAKTTTRDRTKPPPKAASREAAPAKPSARGWQKPRILRHGNMRQLSQMSG